MSSETRNIIAEGELHFGYTYRGDGQEFWAAGCADVSIDGEGLIYIGTLSHTQSPLMTGMLLTADQVLAMTDPGPAEQPAEISISSETAYMLSGKSLPVDPIKVSVASY